MRTRTVYIKCFNVGSISPQRDVLLPQFFLPSHQGLARLFGKGVIMGVGTKKNGNLHFGGRFLDDHPKFVVILFFRRPSV